MSGRVYGKRRREEVESDDDDSDLDEEEREAMKAFKREGFNEDMEKKEQERKDKVHVVCGKRAGASALAVSHSSHSSHFLPLLSLSHSTFNLSTINLERCTVLQFK